MNALVERNELIEMKCGNNFAYILQDETQFLSTEYKVLLSQQDGNFIKCMKMLYNGKLQFYYLLKEYRSLAVMLPTLDASAFMTIVASLFSSIMDVRNNGFLSCKNIDISYEHIYVEPNTYKVSLVYLPANIHFFPDDAAFENELRTGLVKTISSIANLESPKTMQLRVDLSNGMLSMADLATKVKGGSVTAEKKEAKGNYGNGAILQLVAMNAPERLVFDIKKAEFLLGKKSSEVDGAITFNKMISRIHCKINKTAYGYIVTDLQSTNGTYVNRKRVQPNQSQLLVNGDILRLANTDFQVVIRG